MALTKEYLLQKLWESCTPEEILEKGYEKGILRVSDLREAAWKHSTFDEILDHGLENNYIGSESIINAASEYSDPNKEFSDDELKEIIKETDLNLILDVLNEKYSTYDIIENLDESDILSCFDWDSIYDYFSTEIDEEVSKAEEAGYEDGYSDAEKHYKDIEKHILRDDHIDNKWRYLCDEVGVGYYDENGLKEKLNVLFKNFNNTIYKKSEESWQI